MKNAFLIIAFIFCHKFLFAQQNKSIDYQYSREEGKYFAFELLIDDNFKTNKKLLINFATNSAFEKLGKITLLSGKEELKLKFKPREESIKSDNPELKFYPVTVDWNVLKQSQLGCEAQIIFKSDKGDAYALPFNLCKISELLDKD